MTASTSLVFPKGDKVAIVSSRGRFSFDDLHRLRPHVRRALAQTFPIVPRRILGCLTDDVDALFALLFLTEITDYMPINPALSEVETSQLLQSSGADAAVVSRAFVATKGPTLSPIPTIVWEDVLEAAFADLSHAEDPSDPFDAATPGRLILHTSGSTGKPKRVPISLRAMNASAINIAKAHGLGADDHALNALPTFHIGALVDVMLAPFAAEGAISITNARAPQGLVQALNEQRPTWLQVVPTLLRRMVEDIAPDDLKAAGKSLRFIRSISAPVPPDLKEQVELLFGCPVIEMYGMTETAGQIATVARPPATTKSGSVGQPVGVEVAIMDRTGNPRRSNDVGEVCVKGPTVFEGYEVTDNEDVFFAEWFRTGDLGKLDEDGFLFLQGRLKEMVNVGGEKVSPHEVETAALHMPDVIEAAAYAVPHPTLGEQVGLTIATRGSVTPDGVKTFMEDRLAGFKCPNTITIVDQLPRLANAKVDRVLLKRDAATAWATRQSSSTAEPAEQTTPEARLVAQHWARILKCRTPSQEDDFFDMGGDSLSATQLLLSLEKALGREISPNQLFDAPTFAGLVATLSDDDATPAQPTSRPVRYIQEQTAGWPGQIARPNGLLRSIGSLKTGHPLFWASQANAEIAAIRDTLGKSRPLYVTGSLRRFKRRTEQHFEMVGVQLADEITAIQPTGPIALGGFCGGAWVMHHAAQELLKRGRSIRAFISFDYWPNRPLTYPVIHCMSHCDINAARVHYADHTLAAPLLHLGGMTSLDVDSTHRFDAADVVPHAAVLNDMLDGKQSPASVPQLGPDAWTLPQRQETPQARISLTGRPKLYTPGGTATFQVEVTNLSGTDWAPTQISGLSVQVDLVNLDGHMRKANLAFGAFENFVKSGDSAQFSFDVTFPEKRVPMWFTCSLVSQGLTHFRTRKAGAHRSLIFPNVFAARMIKTSA